MSLNFVVRRVASRHVGLQRFRNGASNSPRPAHGKQHPSTWAINPRLIHIGDVLIPPAIFTGLFLVLWCWKCIMLIIFQNTIIYNPFMPPDARSLRIADFAKQCGGVQWREERLKSLDGTEVALCVADVPALNAAVQPKILYILYFQGA